MAFGCTRFHEYIYGMSTIEVETDHKPLEAIFKKPLHQAPARLQKMIMSAKVPNQPCLPSWKTASDCRHSIKSILTRTAGQLHVI